MSIVRVTATWPTLRSAMGVTRAARSHWREQQAACPPGAIGSRVASARGTDAPAVGAARVPAGGPAGARRGVGNCRSSGTMTRARARAQPQGCGRAAQPRRRVAGGRSRRTDSAYAWACRLPLGRRKREGRTPCPRRRLRASAAGGVSVRGHETIDLLPCWSAFTAVVGRQQTASQGEPAPTRPILLGLSARWAATPADPARPAVV